MRFGWTVAAAALLAPAAQAVIMALLPLGTIVADSQHVFVARVESVDPTKPALVAVVKDELKGKADFQRIPLLLAGSDEAKKLGHVPMLLKRVAKDVDMVWFVLPPRGKKTTAYAFFDGTWIQAFGTRVDKDRVVWQLGGAEPYLRRTYKGTTAEMLKTLRDGLDKKAAFPPVNEKETPGFGPELPGQSSRFADDGELSLGVIPTLEIGGPLAILAILFPTVFGGVLVLFRQWTAFIGLLSVNSTLCILHWWKGRVWLRGSWWTTEIGMWFLMTAVVALCLIWAWRRQLHNLAQGADALETPTRTELLVLAILTVTCLGIVGATYCFSPADPRDLTWNVTRALAAGIALGLGYKVVRSLFETMIPMATEGVMIGGTLLGHLVILGALIRLSAAPVESGLEGGPGAKSGDEPHFHWSYVTKERGMFVSAPLVADGKVFAACSHPVAKAGTLFCLDLATGKQTWEFIDDGDFRQVFSSPAVGDGRVYIGEGFHEDPNCKVYAIDAKTGDKVWEFKTAGQTESTPILVGPNVCIGAGNDGFLCLSPEGRELWRFPEKGASGRLLRFGAAAAHADGKLFVGTGVDRLQTDDKGETAFFALDAGTGKQAWKTPMPLPVWGAPTVAQGKVFVAVGNGDVFTDADAPAGAVLCLDPATGSVVWRRDLPNAVLQRPAVGESHVYASNRDGHVYALDPATGEVKWKAALGSPVVAAPTLAIAKDGKTRCVYATSSAGKFVCLHPSTGAVVWERTYARTALDPLFVSAPAVVVREVDGHEVRHAIFAGGDKRGGEPAVVVCIEDRKAIEGR